MFELLSRRALLLLLGALLSNAAWQEQQSQPPIRTGVVLVPIDVRVVDKADNPITDLTAADFTVLEDGVPQRIAHFQTVSFTGASTAPGEPTPLSDLATTQRTFVILLGRGRLNQPARALDALIDFVRTKIARTDRLAVFAYLRITTVTTDHEAVAKLLERYRDRHEAIEGYIDSDFKMTTFGGPKLASHTTRAIDALFAAPGLPEIVELPGAEGNHAVRYGDGTYLMRTLDFLRRVSGEKHLLFVSESRLRLGRIEQLDRHYYVQVATATRVAMTLIRTGGGEGQYVTRARALPPGRRQTGPPPPRITDFEFFAPADLARFAAHTGGISAFYQDAFTPLARLARITSFQYLLGYYPSRGTSEAAHRVVEVRVNRRDVTVFHRHGYNPKPPAPSPDDYRKAVADTRITAAAERLLNPPYRDPSLPNPIVVRLRLSATISRAERTARDVKVTVAFDPTRVVFAKEDDRHVASLDLGVFIDDAAKELVGELQDRVEVKLTDEELTRAGKKWLEFDVTVRVDGEPAQVRAVLYDYAMDRTSSGRVRLRK